MSAAIERGASPTSEGESKKGSSGARDDRGRFVKGSTGNPLGRRPSRFARELLEAEREGNVQWLTRTRDDAKADPWLQFECVKLLMAHDLGKPMTGGGQFVNVNVNAGVSAIGAPQDPVDACVSLATQGDSMSEEQRAAILASIFSRAESAAARVAERMRRPALTVDSAPASAAEPERTTEPEPARPSPPVAQIAAPAASNAVAPVADPLEPPSEPPAPIRRPDDGMITSRLHPARIAAEERQAIDRRVEQENARAREAARIRAERERAEAERGL